MKNNKKIILVIILIILVTMISFIVAKYKSKANSAAELEIAYYVIGTEFQMQNLKLDSIVPRKDPYNYSISISNEENGKITDTEIEYIIQIKATTNLPIEYSLFEEGKTNNLVENTELIQDENGMYYTRLTTGTKQLGLEKEKHKYILSIKFPEEYKANSEYSDTIELLEITVDSKQKI